MYPWRKLNRKDAAGPHHGWGAVVAIQHGRSISLRSRFWECVSADLNKIKTANDVGGLPGKTATEHGGLAHDLSFFQGIVRIAA
jgi:hypothetical protein